MIFRQNQDADSTTNGKTLYINKNPQVEKKQEQNTTLH